MYADDTVFTFTCLYDHSFSIIETVFCVRRPKSFFLSLFYSGQGLSGAPHQNPDRHVVKDAELQQHGSPQAGGAAAAQGGLYWQDKGSFPALCLVFVGL